MLLSYARVPAGIALWGLFFFFNYLFIFICQLIHILVAAQGIFPRDVLGFSLTVTHELSSTWASCSTACGILIP